jgi:hypothetical protein
MRPVRRMAEIEERAPAVNDGTKRVILLFVAVVIGILSNWVLSVSFFFLSLPTGEQTFSTLLSLFGPLAGFTVRTLASLIIGGVVFFIIHTRINTNTSESKMTYFLAFQNGFFWQAIFSPLLEQ